MYTYAYMHTHAYTQAYMHTRAYTHTHTTKFFGSKNDIPVGL